MSAAKQLRQKADECLRLANESPYHFVREALTELAAALMREADELEDCTNPSETGSVDAEHESKRGN